MVIVLNDIPDTASGIRELSGRYLNLSNPGEQEVFDISNKDLHQA
jgi:hypothetical protein